MRSLPSRKKTDTGENRERWVRSLVSLLRSTVCLFEIPCQEEKTARQHGTQRSYPGR